MARKNQITWKYAIGDRIVSEDKDVTIIDRKFEGHKQYYKIKCNKCGFDSGKHIPNYSNPNREYRDEYWVSYDTLKKQTQCPCCGELTRLVAVGINDIPTTDPHLVKFFPGGYEQAKLYHKTSEARIDFLCPDCGTIVPNFIIRNFTKKKNFCPACGGGGHYPNRLMFNILNQLNIDFEPEYSPDWIGKRRYDFYLPKFKLIIEMDGGLGHGNQIHKKSTMTLEESIEIDKYKNQQAYLHGLKVIRIDCVKSEFDYIYTNIINSELNKIFNFDSINWNEVRMNSLTSNMLNACKLYADGQLEIKIIAKEIGMKPSSVRYYLHEGTSLGLCNYDTKKLQKIKARPNSGSFPSQRVICLNTLEIFDTIRLAEEKYHIKNISMNCMGKRLYAGVDPVTYMPLVWAYYDDYLKMSYADILEKLDIPTTKGRPIPVICLQTLKIFPSFEHAAKEYGLKSKHIIKKCCEGEKEYYGILSDGTKLQWMYYKDYVKQQESQQDSLLLCSNL